MFHVVHFECPSSVIDTESIIGSQTSDESNDSSDSLRNQLDPVQEGNNWLLESHLDHQRDSLLSNKLSWLVNVYRNKKDEIMEFET